MILWLCSELETLATLQLLNDGTIAECSKCMLIRTRNFEGAVRQVETEVSSHMPPEILLRS
jgi:hypothetical protein